MVGVMDMVGGCKDGDCGCMVVVGVAVLVNP